MITVVVTCCGYVFEVLCELMCKIENRTRSNISVCAVSTQLLNCNNAVITLHSSANRAACVIELIAECSAYSYVSEVSVIVISSVLPAPDAIHASCAFAGGGS